MNLWKTSTYRFSKKWYSDVKERKKEGEREIIFETRSLEFLSCLNDNAEENERNSFN